MSKTSEIQDKKSNARLYPIYKMISWDLLFYYPIIYLFLTQVKCFSPSQVLLSEAFFTASCLIVQIPIGLIVHRFGKKNSLVFANICMCVFITSLIFTRNYYQLLMSYLIESIGYVIKGVCETNILYDSLPRGKKRGGLYSTIDGLGVSRYYIIDAVSALIAGFTFVINPYIPIILCLICNVISTILSSKFRHTKIIENDKENKIVIKKYLKELKETIKFSKNSIRMRSLLIVFALMSGLFHNITTFRSGVLEQIKLPEEYFGIVFAIGQIVAAICSRAQGLIHKKFRNKTLAHLGIPLTVSCIIIGFLSMADISIINTSIIIFLFIMQGAIKGPYNVLIYRYLNNFTNKDVRTKLSIVRNMVYNISSILISLLGAYLLNYTNASNSILIVGCLATIIMIVLFDYMRDKVGLRPEKYNKEDLKYSQLIKNK